MSFSSGFSFRGLFEWKNARTGRPLTGLPAGPTGQGLRSQGRVEKLGGFSFLVCDSWPHGRGRGELEQMGGNFAKPPALLYKVKKPLKNACGRSTFMQSRGMHADTRLTFQVLRLHARSWNPGAVHSMPNGRVPPVGAGWGGGRCSGVLVLTRYQPT